MSKSSIKMQITNKFCAVTLIHCFVWVLVLCQSSSLGLDVSSSSSDDGSSRALSDHQDAVDAAEIISGRPKINYGTNLIKFRFLLITQKSLKGIGFNLKAI